ncbi:unnamed protein product [Vitrella brassicaformis CCMP3155]|uniref:Zinc/iron permease n=2 Tax=Vitrella brassicaformis TaxID=1169539 RepID=A0A0G4EEZ9_VITBC|nr:unnamed protein product [Vitrella brassicaformis CCMP3155]|mmetsp:Transcript_23745/g.58724  ORF Transcript_23745/g.58724 Transcript_23745/m.58724 type:complete len:372 (+) Transcript_23745:114-1229(+)|eukprot:CEL93966.1 unnamed protein product [Vitrella brassicaformis CCMP3155]
MVAAFVDKFIWMGVIFVAAIVGAALPGVMKQGQVSELLFEVLTAMAGGVCLAVSVCDMIVDASSQLAQAFGDQRAVVAGMLSWIGFLLMLTLEHIAEFIRHRRQNLPPCRPVPFHFDAHASKHLHTGDSEAPNDRSGGGGDSPLSSHKANKHLHESLLGHTHTHQHPHPHPHEHPAAAAGCCHGEDGGAMAKMEVPGAIGNLVGSDVEDTQWHALREKDIAWFPALVLFVAISVHSFIEGMGLGSATVSVASVGIAIIAHKSLAGFALGTSLVASGLPIRQFLASVLTFSLMTPLGAALGLTILYVNQGTATGATACGVLSALAAGTFFYVALYEIIPKCLREGVQGLACLYKIVAVWIGAAVMTAVAFQS